MGRVSDAREKLVSAVWELMWTGSYGQTTIDQICDKAGVKKGSFYHFFDDKADLASVALDECWEKYRSSLDAVFSPTVPPLERLQQFFQIGYEKQLEMKKQYGSVQGCPLFALGAEICNSEAKLRTKIQKVFQHHHQYFESAIRDAHAIGLIYVENPAVTARILFAYSEGLLTQARILNDTDVLKEMWNGALAILGVSSRQPVSV
ncbi:MAG: TetR family transcriptional regulator [Verrucomicrobiales bacterium]|nr:TetR family transcriptional regulator [Verrucomicrobiales bacterium]